MNAIELRGMLWRTLNDLQHLENTGPRTTGKGGEQSEAMTLAATHIAGGAACIKQALASVDESPEMLAMKNKIKGTKE